MKTIIMAGGCGTRIAELFPKIPKPLIPISNSIGVTKPVLEWEIQSLREQGFKEIILTVGYRAQQIKDYFGDGSRFGVEIQYFVEHTALGNAGALMKMRNKLDSDFLLLNADAVFDVDFNRMVNFHSSHGGDVTIFTHPNNHPYDSGIVIAGEDGRVKQWLAKEDKKPEWYKNCVNAGIHVINPAILDLPDIDIECIGKKGPDGKVIKVDLDRHLLKPLCNTGRMYCYNSPEYVKDMGTPERYHQVIQDFRNGIVEAKNLRHMQRAIFLDRDGTINVYKGFLKRIEDFELLDGVVEAIKKINRSGYLCVLVTNQPVISRGEVTTGQIQEIHNKLEMLLGAQGAYLDGLYYCPHHPDRGFEGEIKELKIECDCRKPKPGMLLKAAIDFNIDLKVSWMIGDGENDVKAGKNAGCKTVLVGTEDYGQEITATSLLEAVDMLLSKELRIDNHSG